MCAPAKIVECCYGAKCEMFKIGQCPDQAWHIQQGHGQEANIVTPVSSEKAFTDARSDAQSAIEQMAEDLKRRDEKHAQEMRRLEEMFSEGQRKRGIENAEEVGQGGGKTQLLLHALLSE